MKLKYLFALPFAVLAMISCEDLDTRPEGDILTTDQKDAVKESMPDRAEAGVRSIYANYNVYAPNYDLFGSVRHNDFGYSANMMFFDANTEDQVAANTGYNWAGNSLMYTDRPYTSYESDIVWNNYYKIIFSANTLIASIDADTKEPLWQFYLAQGLATRGFAYLELAQLYQFNYKGHESSPCVPLITDKNNDEVVQKGAKRASVQDVYTQVEADLTQAIALLTSAQAEGEKRSDRRFVDLATAYGLRARMNLAMQKWNEAASDATNAIELSDAEPSDITVAGKPGLCDMTEDNWMWGIYIAETDDVVSSGIVNWISHCGTFNYGYCWYSGGHQINKKLYASIPDTDVRKGWWTDATGISKNLTADQQWFMSTYVEYDPYTTCKFDAYQHVLAQETNANDIPLMRIEEMYLIKAEAEAMSGQDGKSTLENFVRTYRDPNYTCTGDVQEAVYWQKRIELWGEGRIWFDVMRLGKGIDRRGGGFTAEAVYVIDPNDEILLWRLPQSEIQANPAITDGDNNAGTTPTPVKES